MVKMGKYKEHFYELFYIKHHDFFTTIINYIILLILSVIVKIGLLAHEEIINGIAFNSFVWAVIISLLVIKIIRIFNTFKTPMIMLSTAIILGWILIKNTWSILGQDLLLIISFSILFICIIYSTFKKDHKKC